MEVNIFNLLKDFLFETLNTILNTINSLFTWRSCWQKSFNKLKKNYKKFRPIRKVFEKSPNWKGFQNLFPSNTSEKGFLASAAVRHQKSESFLNGPSPIKNILMALF